MTAREIIYNRFIMPFVGKTSRNIGVELEFPLINKSGGNIDLEFVQSLPDYVEHFGFHPVLFGVNGEKLFMENDCGDCLSFDNSYNNFEFSMNHSDNLSSIFDRFDRYLSIVRDYLAKKNHILCGRGTNPNQKSIEVYHAPFATYNMVSEYLHKFPGEHNYPDFPAFMSSVQTHLDIDDKHLPFAYTLFAKLDFVRGILFFNSPDFENTGYRIFRDYLWEKSGFGNCPGITGSVDGVFKTTDDIINFFLQKGMFNRVRNGKYEIFSPVPIRDYFEDKKYGAVPDDINYYLSFRNVEITARGTLEIRSDCAQPDGSFFAPPAFNLGILENTEAASDLINSFFEKNGITLSNSELRKIVTDGKDFSLIAPSEEVHRLTEEIKDVAYNGLKKRGKCEEKLFVKKCL